MTRIAPLQRYNLFKTFIYVFLGMTAVWAAISLFLFETVLLNWFTFIISLVLAIALTWPVYQRYYYTALSYDEQKFELEKARFKFAAKWSEVDEVSLVHLGYGEFAVRLYKEGQQWVDLPASTLKLDPSKFRFQVIEMVNQARGAKKPSDKTG